ncbi:MAG: PD-(D/E)XK nuclease-like domain-containing protein, partial [Lutibacter sp.]|jgi:hypothetical protein
LKAFRKSPKHYIQYLTEKRAPTDAMLIGSIVDCLALTPELFDKKFRVYAKPNMRTNAGKSEFAKLLQSAGELKQMLIDNEQLLTAQKTVAALYSHPEAKMLLEAKKKAQIKLSWTDRINSLPIVGYVDFETYLWGEKFIVDLKTTKDADPDIFVKDYIKFDYLLQTGTYLCGYHKTRFSFPYMIYLAVETDEPFNVSVNFIESKEMEKAEAEFNGTLKAFRYCMDNALFGQGYEFRLFGTKEYFALRLPGYWKPTFGNFNTEPNEPS